MSTLELCKKYFKTRNIYNLLEVEKDAQPKDIKKAYYKLSLQVHPDRVTESEKQVATEKFKVLSKIYQVLCDNDKRALYDEQGIIDDDDDVDSNLISWIDLWRKIFKPLTEDDIENYEKSYIDSELERADIKKAYLLGKGCINTMMNEVPFMKVEDEPRIKKIVQDMINANEVPEFKIFTEEPAQKRNRRHKKYAKESKEADEIKKKLIAKRGLEQQMMARKQSREISYNTLMDRLLEKYGTEDDSEVVDFSKLDKKKSSKAKKNSTQTRKAAANGIKKGRVTKEKN